MSGQSGPPSTGDGGVDEILSALDRALDTEGHDPVEALTEAHGRLQARLAGSADDPPRPG